MVDQVLSILEEWAKKSPRLGVLDFRPAAEFLQYRLLGSANLPLADLPKRMFCLPPPTVPFAIILPSSQYHVVSHETDVKVPSKRQADSDSMPCNTSSECSNSTPVYLKGCSSLVEFLTTRGWAGLKWQLMDSEQLWEAAEKLQLLERGAQDKDALSPLRRFLFQPCALLEEEVDRIERVLASQRCSCSEQHQCQRQQSATAEATFPVAPCFRLRLWCLEPGCGSARNMAWLAARQSSVRLDSGCTALLSWDVAGLDLWHSALARTEDFFSHVGITPEQCTLYHAEINEESGALKQLKPPASAAKQADKAGGQPRYIMPTPPQLPASAYDLVLCVRFLVRSFNAAIRECLAPGGVVLFNTFLDMEGTRAFGRPQGEGHLLQPGELSTTFGPDHGFQVLRDGHEVEEPHGRELSMFVAVKQPGPGMP